MTRGLYAWLFTTLDGCLPLRSLLDTEDGLRRMDRAEKATYQVMVSFGRLIRGPVPGYEHRPIEFQTATLSLWVRPEVPDPGDLLLEDIQDRIMRALVWRSPNDLVPGQDCTGSDPGIVVMDVEHLDGDSEPGFDDLMQAWTKSINLRFLVSLATCAPRLHWCGPCGAQEALEDAGGIAEPSSLPFAGTAFTFVDNGDETLVDDYDLYVAHPTIDVDVLKASVAGTPVVLAYVIASLTPRYASAFYTAYLAVMVEGDFWHSGPPAPGNRIERDATTWLVRPSASLGTRLANFYLGALSSEFDGAMEDEAQAMVPDEYWSAFKLVDPADNGGLPLTDADRPYWDGQWTAMHLAFQSTLKAGFGSQRALIANSAGAVYAGIDGITKERSHIIDDGEAVTRAEFEQQRLQWEAAPHRYGPRVLNVTWNYDLPGAPAVFRGTQT